MKLREIAHVRTGDKGNTLNIAVIPYDEAEFPRIASVLTSEFVKDFYSDFVHGPVERFEVDGIKALNFVLYDCLDGGVTKNLRVDKNGKSLGLALLEIEI